MECEEKKLSQTGFEWKRKDDKIVELIVSVKDGEDNA